MAFACFCHFLEVGEVVQSEVQSGSKRQSVPQVLGGEMHIASHCQHNVKEKEPAVDLKCLSGLMFFHRIQQVAKDLMFFFLADENNLKEGVYIFIHTPSFTFFGGQVLRHVDRAFLKL